MADGRHFEKTVKSLYLFNRLTDFDKIWYSDAYWPLTADLTLKFAPNNPYAKNPRLDLRLGLGLGLGLGLVPRAIGLGLGLESIQGLLLQPSRVT